MWPGSCRATANGGYDDGGESPFPFRNIQRPLRALLTFHVFALPRHRPGAKRVRKGHETGTNRARFGHGFPLPRRSQTPSTPTLAPPRKNLFPGPRPQRLARPFVQDPTEANPMPTPPRTPRLDRILGLPNEPTVLPSPPPRVLGVLAVACPHPPPNARRNEYRSLRVQPDEWAGQPLGPG